MTWTIGLLERTAESSVQQDGRCVSQYRYQYLVRTDEATLQTAAQVATAVGITRGSPLAEDTNAICYKASIGPVSVPTRPPFQAFLATYEWATNAPLPISDSDDPTKRRTIWSISPQIQSRYVIKDRHGKLIVNTAGTPYDGGIPVDIRLGSVTATRNKSASGYDKNAVLENSGKLNSGAFLGGDEGTVQVDISAQEKYEGGYHYWAEVYTFSYDPQGWQPKPASAGFYRRRAAGSNVLVRITNGDLDPEADDPDGKVPEPEPLDGIGLLVQPENRPDDCAFVDVDYYQSMDFNTFGL